MAIIRIYVDGDVEQPTPTPTPEPPADLQAEITRINAALCDALTRIAKIEGEVRRLRARLIDNDAEEQVP
jgi:predicted  nucleic acid-binding Zn-ribbon protein